MAISISDVLNRVFNAVTDRFKVEVGSITAGTGATDLGKAEDAAHTSGDVGVMALAVQKTTAAGLAADGDYAPLEVNASGQLHVAPLVAGTALIGKVGIDQTTLGTTNRVDIGAALPAGSNAIGKLGANSGVDIGDVDVLSVAAGANVIGKVGIDQTTPGTTNAVDIKTTAATALDSTNKVPVSLYAKDTVAGDTVVKVGTAGNLGIMFYGTSSLADGAGNDVVQFKDQANGLATWGAESRPMHYNGTTWDRQRGNVAVTLLASAARTATVSSADQVNYNGRGVKVYINVTASADTPSVVFAIEEKDPVSGTYTAILTAAAMTGTAVKQLTAYPGVTAVANLVIDLPLARTWRVTATHADADSITYSVAATTLL